MPKDARSDFSNRWRQRLTSARASKEFMSAEKGHIPRFS